MKTMISTFSYSDVIVMSPISIKYTTDVLEKTHQYKSHLQIEGQMNYNMTRYPPLFTSIDMVELSYQITHKASHPLGTKLTKSKQT